MARKATKQEATATAVAEAAQRQRNREGLEARLNKQLKAKTATVTIGIADKTLDKAWSEVTADVKTTLKDKDLTEQERVSAIADAVAPFMRVAASVEGPGVEALQEATRIARKVDGYRQRAARLLTRHNVPAARVAEICGFSKARADQYRSALTVQTLAKAAGLKIGAADAEDLAKRGRITAAKDAISKGSQATLDSLTGTEGRATQRAAKVSKQRDAVTIRQAVADLLALTVDATVDTTDLKELEAALGDLAKITHNVQAFRTNLVKISADSAA